MGRPALAADATLSAAVDREVPRGPRGGLLLGNVRDFQRDKLGFVQGMARRYGDVVRYRMANMTWYQVNHPEGVKRILQDNNRNYGKGSLTSGALGLVLGQGLSTSEGGLWLRQRRLMQPVFHRKSVDAFGEMMVKDTEAMITRWQASPDTTVDVAAEMSRLTQGVVTGALFGAGVGEEAGVIEGTITTLMTEVAYRFEVPLYPPLSVPTPRNRRTRAALRTLDRAVYRIIEERRRAKPGDDLLSLLMETRDEDTGEAMNDKQLRDEVITLFVAGHETTATALSWTFYLLATHPEAEERVRAELDEVLGPEGRTPTVEDLPKLSYGRMVVEEAMRLYPPAWITNRQALSEDVVLGYRIPAGAFVMTLPYVLHRHPDFWERPDEFDPERFSPERSAIRPRYAYFPFGGGPRQCIGRGMALVETHLILSTVFRRCRMRLATQRPVEPLALATLRPSGGLPMRIEAA